MSAYTRQKANSKYRNCIRLERSSQKQSSDTHKTPYDRVKRCRERKINTKASESVNWHVEEKKRGISTSNLDLDRASRRPSCMDCACNKQPKWRARKPAYQRHRPTRFPHAKTRERASRGLHPAHIVGSVVICDEIEITCQRLSQHCKFSGDTGVIRISFKHRTLPSVAQSLSAASVCGAGGSGFMSATTHVPSTAKNTYRYHSSTQSFLSPEQKKSEYCERGWSERGEEGNCYAYIDCCLRPRSTSQLTCESPPAQARRQEGWRGGLKHSPHDGTAKSLEHPFRTIKHYDNGYMQFLQVDILKNHIKNCKDSSFESQQVITLIPPAASMGTDSTDDYDGTVNANDGMRDLRESVNNARCIFPEDPNELIDRLRYLIDLLKHGDLSRIVEISSVNDELKNWGENGRWGTGMTEHEQPRAPTLDADIPKRRQLFYFHLIAPEHEVRVRDSITAYYSARITSHTIRRKAAQRRNPSVRSPGYSPLAPRW
ncbi:hypothetical protein PR048_015577 [Dryococelus australis]|uniref:Uncharacterized protein n=1 Tax=Dryococelus australis TaxID=614101 RepID=A0ABQ9HHA8_9NEOP|nr:hypothetical protein PR048_015577 [Dryococelus australis]